MKNEVDGRREIASRNTAWANNIARKLTRWGVTPNQISMMSVFFAMVGCLLLIGTVIYPDFNKYVTYILFIVCMHRLQRSARRDSARILTDGQNP